VKRLLKFFFCCYDYKLISFAILQPIIYSIFNNENDHNKKSILISILLNNLPYLINRLNKENSDYLNDIIEQTRKFIEEHYSKKTFLAYPYKRIVDSNKNDLFIKTFNIITEYVKENYKTEFVLNLENISSDNNKNDDTDTTQITDIDTNMDNFSINLEVKLII
jgi:hypothetical protein